MSKQLHIKRLKIAMKELFQSYKLLLYTMPLFILFFFALLYFVPGGIFYNRLFNPAAFPNQEIWIQALLSTRFDERIFILLLPIAYTMISTWRHFEVLNKSERINLTPITYLERTVAITLFCVAGLLLGTLCFILYDYISVWWFKYLYYEQVLHYLEQQGDLYPSIGKSTVFFTIPIWNIGVISIVVLSLMPLYFLSRVFFKKYSVFLFWVLMVGIWTMLFSTFYSLRPQAVNANAFPITLQQAIPVIISTILYIVYWCLAMATFYHKLKEKEI